MKPVKFEVICEVDDDKYSEESIEHLRLVTDAAIAATYRKFTGVKLMGVTIDHQFINAWNENEET